MGLMALVGHDGVACGLGGGHGGEGERGDLLQTLWRLLHALRLHWLGNRPMADGDATCWCCAFWFSCSLPRVGKTKGCFREPLPILPSLLLPLLWVLSQLLSLQYPYLRWQPLRQRFVRLQFRLSWGTASLPCCAGYAASLLPRLPLPTMVEAPTPTLTSETGADSDLDTGTAGYADT